MAKILRNIGPVCSVYGELWKIRKHKKEIKKALSAGDHEKAREWMLAAINIWTGDIEHNFKAKVNVKGRENIPEKGPVFFVSNHQGFADIPAIYYAINTLQAGFIAKDSLSKVPLYGDWVTTVGGLYLERDNPRAAVKTFTKAEEMMKEGYSFVIFPEGTRSKTGVMGEFKKGAFKAPLKMGVPIVPITVSGTRQMLEVPGYLRGGECTVVIHKPVETAGLDRKAQAEIPDMVYKTIRDELDKYEPQGQACP